MVRTGEPFIGVGRDGTWESRFVWAAPQPVVMEERGEIWIYYSGVNRDHAGILDPKAPPPPAEGCIPEKSGGSLAMLQFTSSCVVIHLQLCCCVQVTGEKRGLSSAR